MFRWLNKQGVESDKGFAVQFLARYSMEYREGERRMLLGVEGGGAYGNIIVQNPNHWEPPHTTDILTDEELRQIRANITEALRFQQLEPEFVDR